MAILDRPWAAGVVARGMQALMPLAAGGISRRNAKVFPEIRVDVSELTIPTSYGPAAATVYRPSGGERPNVHVNFHGGGFVMPGAYLDDPLCRFLAAEAGVVVVNVEYVVAPKHPFPAAPKQSYEIVRWVAEHGGEQGWDEARLTIGGQSAGGGLAAAVARQALDQGGPAIALQVLHYPPLDLTPGLVKRAGIDRPMLRPWMGKVFNGSYLPDKSAATDPLVSPAGAADDADLTGIAPALIITPEYDLLHAEGVRYAERLRAVGALVEHIDVPGADHAYDMNDHTKAREIYGRIATHLKA